MAAKTAFDLELNFGTAGVRTPDRLQVAVRPVSPDHRHLKNYRSEGYRFLDRQSTNRTSVCRSGACWYSGGDGTFTHSPDG
jgi:hypothetical protein